jgi:hypothetical protein
MAGGRKTQTAETKYAKNFYFHFFVLSTEEIPFLVGDTCTPGRNPVETVFLQNSRRVD